MDMEALFTELLNVNREILREIKVLRQAMGHEAIAPQQSGCQETASRPQSGLVAADGAGRGAAGAVIPPQSGLPATDAGGRMPVADVAGQVLDLGQGAFRPAPPRYTPKDLEAMSPIKPKQAPPRYTPKDLEDMRGQIMNQGKREDAGSAFAQFEKRRKDW